MNPEAPARIQRTPPALADGPHDRYFNGLQRALAAGGIAWPCIAIDLARLRRNAVRLASLIAPGTRLRLVEKSLPVPALLEEAMRLTGTRAMMVFDAPQLVQIAARFPDADVLMGKPMPVRAARYFYRAAGHREFDPVRQLQWLIDTPRRLAEYAGLARDLDTTLRINVEVDVGLHRGGVPDAEALRALLVQLKSVGGRLCFAGLMGYDAHVGKLPALVERPRDSFARAVAAYRQFQAAAIEAFPEAAAGACWNGAGSPTVPLHRQASPLNDLSVGSLLLKAADFDTPLLAAFEPAIFIATPVLKALAGTRLPGPAWLSRLLYAGRPARARSYFIYGGGWPARPVSPAGIVPNRQFGRSFNQAILNGAREHPLEVDDFVFLRPYQSEGTLLHFGPVRVIDGDQIVDEWPPLRAG